MFLSIISTILSFLSPFLKVLLIITSPILISIIIIIIKTIYMYFKIMMKEKVIIKRRKRVKEDSVFKRLFVQLPEILAKDKLYADPNRFQEYGIHLIEGRQGSGKTMTAVYLLRKWEKRYPKMKVYTNFQYDHKDGHLQTFDDLINAENGIYGVANVLDEIQTWLSSADSKNVPPEMLAEISQQRKQTKAIIGTVQVFGRVAKPLREQAHFIYSPKTFLGCLTIVRMAYPDDYDPEKNKFKRHHGFFFFVHTKELRECYDTYEKIKRYKETTFTQNSFLADNEISFGIPKEIVTKVK